MSSDEIAVLVIASLISVFCIAGHLFTSRHRVMSRRASAEGIVRLGLLAAMAWITYVLFTYADPSVVGIYRLFYLVLGFAVLHLFGFGGAGRTGMRYSVDVLERNNPAAGLLAASFILATGLIFGGSLWGEADPDGEGEGGWWIPMGFFIAGWISLCIATWLYRLRETGGTVRRIRQVRDPREALGFSLYLLSTGWILMESVAGDFHGWRSGLLTTGAIAAMLVVHEIAGLVFNRNANARPKAMSLVEALLYIATTLGFSYVNQHLLPAWGWTI